MKFLLLLLAGTLSLLGADGLPNQPYLYVQGDAEENQPADLVFLRFTLSALQPEQAGANKLVQAQANRVFDLLKAAGVPETDIVASDLSSAAEYETSGDYAQRQGKLLGFRVSRPFEVTVRDLKIFPKLVTDLLELKVERFDSINEGLSTEKKLHDEVWQKAIDDARRRADLLAKAAGMKVDSVYAISPSVIPSISREMLEEENSRSYALAAGSPPTGIDAARYLLHPVKVTQSVHILYLISPRNNHAARSTLAPPARSAFLPTSMAKKPVVLIIRDGWGVNPGGRDHAVENGDATLLSHTPFHDHLYATYPQSRLSASGLDVGLPDGQMGNSEVGHLNLGAGRIVYQDLTRINKAIADGELAANPVLVEAFAKAKGSRLHLLGLVSDGGVHSHQDHLIALCQAAAKAGVKEILIHAITDGRDTSPTSGAGFLATVEKGIAGTGAHIATVIGRYFAMDRDKRWERNKLAWDAIVLGRGPVSKESPSAAVQAAYPADPRGDEFLQPIIFSHANEQRIRDNDVVLWFNFRSDRARQLSEAFLHPDFKGFDREVTPKVHYVTFTSYDKTYKCAVVFGPQSLANILGEVVSKAGLKQLRAAETEKYPHVTFFFNGGIEKPYPGEDRYLVLSPKHYSKDGQEAPLPTYDLKPEMSAPELAFEVRHRLEEYDLVIINFANPDMVGHTGVVQAGIHAVETIDLGVKLIVERTLELGGQLLITADHGNCELMRNPDGSPNTAHTTNLVHFLYVSHDHATAQLHNGILADVAPTLLALLGVPQPKEMTGHSLVTRA